MTIKKILKIIVVYFFLNSISYSIENKILVKLDNEIITTLDVLEEANYLSILNPEFKKLDQKKIFEISKNSLIKEKIKKIDLNKITNLLKISDKTFDEILEINTQKFSYNTKNEFIKNISENNIKLETFREKISIEILWNQLIYEKYISQIKINKKQLEDKINNDLKKTKSYLLQEIVYEIKKSSDLNEIYNQILISINTIGFENAALNYSISSSSKNSGNIGWIEERSVNPLILTKIKEANINQIIGPFNIPGGGLILKIKEIKEVENQIDKEKKLEELIKQNTNQQLSQYSNIYFNKAQKNIFIDEK